MGLDLRLLPFESEMPGNAFSHTILSCDRDYDLFDAVRNIEERRGRKVPASFSTFTSCDEKYEEPHYGNTQDTPYGDPLYEVEVGDLIRIPEPNSQRNMAVWAYLRLLPPRTKVALYWH